MLSNAKIFTMENSRVIERGDILVRGGRIIEVGESLRPPSKTKVVDLTGMVITPGLFDAYTRFGLEEISAVDSSRDGTAEKGGPYFDIQYSLNQASTLIDINLVEGVTRAVSAPLNSDDFFAGFGASVLLGKGKIIEKPRVALFGALTSRASGSYGSRSVLVKRFRQSLIDARQMSVGMMPSMSHREVEFRYSPLELQELAASVKAEIPFVIEVHRVAEIQELITIKRDFGIRVVIKGGAEAWKLAEQLSKNDIGVILDPLDNLPTGFERLGARLDNATLLDKAGVVIAFSVFDTHNSRQMRQIAGNAVANGLSRLSALEAITINPTKLYSLQSSEISPGSQADLIVWNGDPLELDTWASRVMLDGQWINMASRQTRLFERYKNLDVGKKSGFTYQ
tara:strand:- start:1525 stop:2712 length:1188 start_codon:yes stop_codon:yes gene_type:complete